MPRNARARLRVRRAVVAAIALSLGLAGVPARAEVSQVRISHGYGVLYLPLMVMESEKLLEKHARAAGLGEVKAEYRVLDGGNVINDAMLAGALDIASIGVAGFLTLWAKAKDNPALEIRGLSGMSSSSVYLMTRNPGVKSLKDFTDRDRIAVPGIKTSLPAVLLHMAAAKEFGDADYAKLDPITVPLAHPDAVAVMLAGRNEINSHMASPPFSYVEEAAPGIHRVLSTVDVLGNITLDM
ncbi:MAG TPA: ABC transporter substrate-binding protein, partial [Casimicrobiaceae bacterium]|nr:ABC transporter substrate-binding protein [Casimicrobiaceae bacterium]